MSELSALGKDAYRILMSERPFGEWRLEPRGDGFIFYEGTFSRGVPISRAEAEIYMIGDEAAWFDIIHGQEATEPPRPYWTNLLKRMASLPASYNAMFTSVGAGLLADSIRAFDAYEKILGGIAGLTMMAFGAVGFWVGRSRKSNS